MADLVHRPEWLQLESNALFEIREIEEAIWHGEHGRPGERDSGTLARILDSCADQLSIALSDPDAARRAGPKGAYWLFEAGDYLTWTRSALYPARGEAQKPDLQQAAHCLYRATRFLIRLGYSPDKVVPREARVHGTTWPNRRVYSRLEDHVHAVRREFKHSYRIIRAFVLDRDNERCVHCASAENLQVDHIIPVTKWGTNDPSNLQTLCGSCNARKGNRHDG